MSSNGAVHHSHSFKSETSPLESANSLVAPFSLLSEQEESPLPPMGVNGWESIAKSKYNLKTCIESPLAHYYFLEWAEQNYLSEYIHLYDELRSFVNYVKNHSSKEEIVRKLLKLNNFYFGHDAVFKVDLPDIVEVHKAVLAKIRQLTGGSENLDIHEVGIFEHIQEVILQKLQVHFEKFQKSGQMKQLISITNGKSRSSHQSQIDILMNSNNTGIPLNSIFKFLMVPRHPMSVISGLLQFLLDMIRSPEHWKDSHKERLRFNRDSLVSSSNWLFSFRERTSELVKIDLNVLKEEEILPFFVNVYNCLMLDTCINASIAPSNQFSRQVFSKKATYEVGGLEFNLDNILYGILLGNQSNWLQGRRFGKIDARLKFVLSAPVEVIFLLATMTEDTPKIKVMSSKNINLYLEKMKKDYFQNHCKIDESKKVLICGSLISSNLTELKRGKLSEKESILKLFESCLPPKVNLSNGIAFRDGGDNRHINYPLCALNNEALEKIYESNTIRDIIIYDDYKYVGEVRNDFKHGRGELSYSNGTKFFGYFSNDKKNGYGVYICPEYRYYGLWENDEKSGVGVVIHDDGTIFHGRFKKNEKMGEGTILFPTGDSLTGIWNGENVSNGQYRKGKLSNATKCALSLLKLKLSGISDDKLTYGVVKSSDLIDKNSPLLTQHSWDSRKEKFLDSDHYMEIKADDGPAAVQELIEKILENDLKTVIQTYVDIFKFAYGSLDQKSFKVEKAYVLDDLFGFVETVYVSVKSLIGDTLVKAVGAGILKSFLKNYMLKKVYRELFQIYQNIHMEKDLFFKLKISSMSKITTSDIGIKSKLVANHENPFASAIEILEKLGSYENAAEKFKCLEDSANAMLADVNSLKLTSEIGADDLFPVFLYIFIKAKIPNAYSIFYFLRDFVDEVVLDSEQAYRFTNYELALDYIDKLDLNVRDENLILVPISVYESRLEKSILTIKEQHPCQRLLWLSLTLIEAGGLSTIKVGFQYTPGCTAKDFEECSPEVLKDIDNALQIIGLAVEIREGVGIQLTFKKAFPNYVYCQFAAAIEKVCHLF